jgi:dTDP-4-dehydrorhamnose 3,5-epimerase
MNVVKTDIPDVLIFEPRVFGDDRGFSLKALVKNSLRKP